MLFPTICRSIYFQTSDLLLLLISILFVLSCHSMKFIKTNRYQIRTVNIKQGSFFRYPFVTSMLAPVVVSYRYVLLAISFETLRIFRSSFALNIWELSHDLKQVQFVCSPLVICTLRFFQIYILDTKYFDGKNRAF
ncbi:MAG: hypothetical protein SRB2_02814 [Desulfobacteraceae bacterium Eth-SRB2]|nr:MAG: hypothetical protein SRB2_02814 [Desulfobacteraceae bacterium Eth-SRB2]